MKQAADKEAVFQTKATEAVAALATKGAADKVAVDQKCKRKQ